MEVRSLAFKNARVSQAALQRTSYKNAPKFGFAGPEIITPLAIGGGILVALGAALATGFRVVHQSCQGVVERLGKAQEEVKSPGLRYIMPLGIDNLQVVNMQEHPVELPKQNVITKENAPINIDGIIFYQVVEPKKALYNVGDRDDAIQKLAMTTIRNIIGEMTLDETLSGRDKINQKLLEIIGKESERWGIKVSKIELRDVEPPLEIQTAMRRELEAERARRATLIEADAAAKATKMRAEAEAEALRKVQTVQNEMTRQELEAMRDAQPTPEVLQLKSTLALQALSQSPANNLVVVPAGDSASFMGNVAALAATMQKSQNTQNGKPKQESAAGQKA